MKKIRKVIIATFLIAPLLACGGGGEKDQSETGNTGQPNGKTAVIGSSNWGGDAWGE